MPTTLQLKHFQVCRDDRDVVTVWIDHATQKMNVFDDEVIDELAQIVGTLETADQVRLVVFRSAKPSGFMAGADVKQIAELEGDQVDQVLQTGHQLFARVESLPMPTLAVISGPCLGGGLEFALACRYRIAQNSGSTRLGLPEIGLGFIPGWGGTQRLPRRVGLVNSLPMILKGTKLPAEKALKIGLVDRIADESDWKDCVNHFIDDLLANSSMRNHRPTKPMLVRFLDGTGIGRRLVLSRAQKQVAGKVDHYPALAAALYAIEAGFAGSTDGFAAERDAFADLIETQTCRNLLDLFFRRERARSISTWHHATGDARGDDHVKKVGVVGGGAMGAGIAQLAALKGYSVVVKEINENLADAAMERVEKLLGGLVSSRRLPKADAKLAIDRVAVTSHWDALTDADLVIEAVVERDDVKRQVFRELDGIVKPQGLLTTNTSSLSVQRMADSTSRPQQVGGLHFFNPVHRMELVEVVRGRETSDEAIGDLVRFVRALGKTPIVTSNSPGFLVNRVLFPYIGEAIQMVCEGAEISEIDREVRRFGMPMGPLELLDHVGLDVASHVTGSLDSVLRDSDRVAHLLGEMVGSGWIGSKAGRGFYQYAGPGGKRKGPIPIECLVGGPHPPMVPHLDMADDALTDTQRRVIYPLLNEAVRCLEEGVVTEAWMVDLAMVLGTGFAPFRGGPLSMAEQIGWKVIARNMQALEVMYGERFEPAQRMIELADTGGSIFVTGKDQSDVVNKDLSEHGHG